MSAPNRSVRLAVSLLVLLAAPACSSGSSSGDGGFVISGQDCGYAYTQMTPEYACEGDVLVETTGCVHRPDTYRTDCAASGERCRIVQTFPDVGVCRKECKVDADCNAPQRCVVDAAGGAICRA